MEEFENSPPNHPTGFVLVNTWNKGQNQEARFHSLIPSEHLDNPFSRISEGSIVETITAAIGRVLAMVSSK